MATYKDIQDWVKEHHGFVAQTCWIAHCKELNGLSLRDAANRKGEERIKPCPEDKRAAIEQALRHFGEIT
jgi:hypothetical protein